MWSPLVVETSFRRGGAITPVQACPFLILTTAKYPLQADTKPTPRAHITLAEEQMQLGKTKKVCHFQLQDINNYTNQL